MAHIKNKLGFTLLIIGLLALVGCSVSPGITPTSAPTTDINGLSTQIAETVVAQITREAALNPTAVPPTVAPTQTQLPPTAVPTEPAAVVNTPVPTLTTVPTKSGGSYVFIPSATSSYTDQATWVTQTPPDYKVMPAGKDFDGVWTIKNTGKRTWNTQFYAKYVSGTLEATKDIYFLPSPLAVNDTVGFTIDFVAPTTPGTYTSNWKLVNDDGVAFFHFYLIITVK